MNPTRLERLSARLEQLEHTVAARGVRLEDSIARMQGRRMAYTMVGKLSTSSTATLTAPLTLTPIRFDISQDGVFVMTHQPLVAFKATEDESGIFAGRWRPVSHWPMPTQALNTPTISMSYKMEDVGAERRFQNEVVVPSTRLSYPGNLVELARPLVFLPTSSFTFTPIIEQYVDFGGVISYDLVVALPGYKIVDRS